MGAGRALARLHAEAAAGQAAGRGVLLMPHREKGMDEKALPGEYRKVPDVVRSPDEPLVPGRVPTAREQCSRESVAWRSARAREASDPHRPGRRPPPGADV